MALKLDTIVFLVKDQQRFAINLDAKEEEDRVRDACVNGQRAIDHTH